MKNQDQIVQDEMRKLIKRSCVNLTKTSDYYSFHKSLLKFYFNSLEVTINYETANISLWNSKPKDMYAIQLHGPNEAVSETVGYTNLEETLKGCLENGEQQQRFYRTMLFYYNNVETPLVDTGVSA